MSNSELMNKAGERDAHDGWREIIFRKIFVNFKEASHGIEVSLATVCSTMDIHRHTAEEFVNFVLFVYGGMDNRL